MSYRGENHVSRVLNSLSEYDDQVHEKKQTVNNFFEELSQELRESESSLLMHSHFVHVGSSYEGSVVRPNADFDINLMLPKHFNADNFELVERYEPGFYKLRVIDEDDDYDDGNDIVKEWTNRNGYLRLGDMKEGIFEELEECLENIKRMNSHWNLKYKKQLCSMGVTMSHTNGERFKIDLVPAMKGHDLYDIPNARKKNQLPKPLMTRNVYRYGISLTALQSYDSNNDFHLVGTASFGEMEKICLEGSDAVLNAISLAKLVSMKWNWKKQYNLKSFQIKRVAIKNFQMLRNMNDWDAFKYLLDCISDELRGGVIDGYFIKDQNVYTKDEKDARELRSSINKARHTINPSTIRKFIED